MSYMHETNGTPPGNAGTPKADDTRGQSTGGTSRGRRLLIAGLVVALLTVLAAGTALTAQRLAGRSSYQVPPPVELPLFRDGQSCGTNEPPGATYGCTYTQFLCPVAVTWSPDQQQVAILSHCGDFHGTSNKVLVYDTATGHLQTTIALDNMVAHAPGVPDTCEGERFSQALDAIDLFWLPSGKLAVLGSFYLWTAVETSASCPAWDALVLVDADGAHPQVVLAPSRTQQQGDGSIDSCGRTWNLQGASPGPAAASVAGDDCPLLPALGYRWADGGGLQPKTTLNSATVPTSPGPGPVGNPAGGAQFTVWQSATVARSKLTQTPGAAADFYYLVETLGAVSPDGHYVYAGMRLYRLEPAGQQQPSLSDLQQADAANLPLLPVKDAALQRVLSELPPPATGSDGNPRPTVLAWRPDGMVVAALGTDLDHAGQPTDAQQPVRVLDCATGSLRLSLTPLADPAHKQAFGYSFILSWSPDGSHLLLISGSRGTATVWDLSGLH